MAARRGWVHLRRGCDPGDLRRVAAHTQIESGIPTRRFTKVDLSELLRTVIEVYQPMAEEKDQPFTADIVVRAYSLGGPRAPGTNGRKRDRECNEAFARWSIHRTYDYSVAKCDSRYRDG